MSSNGQDLMEGAKEFVCRIAELRHMVRWLGLDSASAEYFVRWQAAREEWKSVSDSAPDHHKSIAEGWINRTLSSFLDSLMADKHTSRRFVIDLATEYGVELEVSGTEHEPQEENLSVDDAGNTTQTQVTDTPRAVSEQDSDGNDNCDQ
ncbi:hypothetical protein M231_05135 [Tremella mesenterica]|uniref:Uncharacterized protein n=1 Tax=Tremella mesenterica TaxID=5217 RepID=A0A4Q1BIS4_TREME|nr:hypothetical protein M231_05135 [Tremella mesenterica]